MGATIVVREQLVWLRKLFVILLVATAMIVSSTLVITNPNIAKAAPIIQMEDTTSTTGQSLWAGRPVHAEYVSPTSILVGKQIDSIVLKLRKSSGSTTGIAEIGVINSDLSMKKVFGTIDVSTIAASYTNYEFVLAGSTYTIQTGDRIGIKYTAGSSSNHVAVMRDTNSAGPFDGANTFHTYYTTSWNNFPSHDLTMVLKLINDDMSDTDPPTVFADPVGDNYGGTQWVTLTSNEPAIVYYTTDGTIPTTASSVFSSVIAISATTTLKFFGVDMAGNAGSVVTETYTVDVTAPAVSASPPGGNYASSQSVALTAIDESMVTIYYSLDGSDPTMNSESYSEILFVSDDATLKFFGVDLAGNVGPIMTEAYDIEITNQTVGDGVLQIYPTKLGGDEWFLKMEDPAADDRFDPKVTITKNPDGTWKAKSTKIRMNVFTDAGYDQNQITTYNQSELAVKGYMQSPGDWKNVEITGYVKVNSHSRDDNFSWYARGGKHSGSEGCEGTAYKGNLFYTGRVRFAKEQWHSGGYSFSQMISVTEPIKDRWVGFKFIVYNVLVQDETGQNVTAARMESWIDKNDNGNWTKVNDRLDAGGWGDEGVHCGGDQDQIINWGGPIATFRWDNASDVDFKNFSVREIASPI
jgi:hypothetical protein